MKLSQVFLAVSLCTALHAAADTRVNVVGLFTDKAIVVINGSAPITLSVGQRSDGVKLIAANSQTATLEIDGKFRQLAMGQAISMSGENMDFSKPSVTLYANVQGHFVADCKINGAGLKYLVDTGATHVTLNSGDALYAKIDYKRGQPVQVSTANGVVNAYVVTIANLKIGSISLSQVSATVLEGGSPAIVLLGMSALSRLEMKRQGTALTLTKKY
jgi:aspartyl protease family protein